jgi:hypothetical protein
MGTATLVTEDVAAGHNLIEALDAAGFPVKAAFWLYDSDTDKWTLWVGTPRAAKDLQRAYMRVGEILSAVPDRKVLELPQIRLVSPDDPTVRAMGSLVSVKGISDVRLRSNVADGIYIEDALIYRTAA